MQTELEGKLREVQLRYGYIFPALHIYIYIYIYRYADSSQVESGKSSSLRRCQAGKMWAWPGGKTEANETRNGGKSCVSKLQTCRQARDAEAGEENGCGKCSTPSTFGA